MSTEKENSEIHPILKSYIPVAEGIALTFGHFCEVTVHDFTDLSASIVAIFNSQVTGRYVGSPITNLGLEVIKKGNDGEDSIINYPNHSSNQKNLKSSSMVIRDELGEIIGCLCINLDLTYLQMSQSVLEGIMAINADKAPEEQFSQTINNLEEQILQNALVKIGKPISLMNKEERESFIFFLDDKGLFLIKGAIQRVAKLLDISKFTLYNYLDKS